MAEAPAALEPLPQPEPVAAPEPELPAQILDQAPVDLPSFQPISVFDEPAAAPAEEPAAEPDDGFALLEIDVGTPAPPSVPLPEFRPISFDPAAHDSVLADPFAIPAAHVPEPVEAAPEPVAEVEDAWVGETVDVPEPMALADEEPAAAAGASESVPVAATPPDDAAADEQPEEGKAQVSALAGKVVDAMIKTISAAVYSKPSSSERAAFLREMAALMEEEARANEGAPPAVTQTVQATPPPPPPVAPQQQVVAEIAVAAPKKPQGEIAEALADRIGPTAALLKSVAQEDDPFARPPAQIDRLQDPKPEETVGADEESGELALTLLDMMAGGSGSALPHERNLASDTLLRILPRIPVKQLLAVVERVAIMETPPAFWWRSSSATHATMSSRRSSNAAPTSAIRT